MTNTNQDDFFTPRSKTNTINDDFFTPIKNKEPEEKQPEEDWSTSIARFLNQGIKAAPYAIPAVRVADITSNLISSAYAVSKSKNELEDALATGNITQEKFDELSQKILNTHQSEYAPTLRNLYNFLEKKTGLPLEAKTNLQKGAQLFSLGATGGPQGPLSKLFTGGYTVSLSSLLQQLGLSEELADNAALLTTGYTTNKVNEYLQQNPYIPKASAGQQLTPSAVSPQQPQPKARQVTPTPNAPALQKLVPTKTTPPPIEQGAPQLLQQTPTYESGAELAQQLPQVSREPRPPVAPEQLPLRLPEPPPNAPKALEKPKPPETPKAPIAPIEPKDVPVDVNAETVKFEDDLGNIVSPERAQTPIQGGEHLVASVNDSARQAWAQDTENYRLSREAVGDHQMRDVNLVSWIDDERNRLLRRPENTLSTFERNYLNRLTNVENYLARIDRQTDELIPGSEQSVQTKDIIELIQSIHGDINAEFIQGNKTNQQRRLTRQITDSVTNALRDDPQASQRWHDARQFHATVWEPLYENPQIQRFRSNKARVREEELYNKATSSGDTYNALHQILTNEFAPQGSTSLQQLQRSKAIDTLDPYIKDPTKVDSLEYRRAIAKLQDVLTRDQILALHRALVERKNVLHGRTRELEAKKVRAKVHARQVKQHVVKVKEHQKAVKAQEKAFEQAQKAQEQEHKKAIEKYEHEQKLAYQDFHRELEAQQQKHETALLEHKKKVQGQKEAEQPLLKLREKTPEQLFDYAHTVSGLKEIVSTASKVGVHPVFIERFRNNVGLDVLTGGKDNITPDNILTILNDVDKKRLIAECLSPETVNKIRNYMSELSRLQKVLKGRVKIKEREPVLTKTQKLLVKIEPVWEVLKKINVFLSPKRAIEFGGDKVFDLAKKGNKKQVATEIAAIKDANEHLRKA